jgi:catechol 2,3-dioxygenase-like lactoylglutathione lyase family enzyme
MLDHIGFAVSDLARSTEFYAKALAPLSIALMHMITREQTGAGAHAGFGAEGKAFFWIDEGKPARTGIHVAFVAPNRATVDAFYRAALQAGGSDNGAPGLRPHYHAHYYGAFVLDPDGYNVEAVCHLPGDALAG